MAIHKVNTCVVVLLLSTALGACTADTDRRAAPSTQGTVPGTINTACAATSATPASTDIATLKVGVMPIADSAAFYIAMKKGYFAKERLNVEPVTVQGGGPAIGMMKGGQLQASIVNYVTAFIAEGRAPGSVTVIAPAYQGAPGAFKLMTKANSPIHRLADLAETKTKVIVATLHSVGTLTTQVALKAEGVSDSRVAFAEVALPDMALNLERGLADAAWMTEPFITEWRDNGGRELYDVVMAGEAALLPIAGWAVTADYAREHSDIVQRLQRALLCGQQDAAANRAEVTEVMRTYTKIKPGVLPRIALGRFPAELNAEALQHLAALVHSYEKLDKPVDVSSMLAPAPPSATSTPTSSAPTTSPVSATPSPSPTPGRS
ncbi:ABC transporter substrate-binding protein [Nonomuraea sp. NPDC049400]|uniref:ABC transporter substrate-binding protein n=1 Tax=Nonomuraea sp. NPDC049400 TaxID=3364352 RepID=UPI003791C1DB